MKAAIFRFMALTAIAVQTFIIPRANAQELHPEDAIYYMYVAVANLHDREDVPKVYLPISSEFMTGCGLLDEWDAIYCPADHSIYIGTEMVDMAYDFGDAALAYLVGHEYAHAMQTVHGFSLNDLPISELQADCLAGAYMAATPDIHFDERDVLEIVEFADSIGDDNVWAQDHGTPDQRVAAVVRGMNSDSFSDCL